MRESKKEKTFHVVGLPHTSTTKKYTSCAFTEKVRKFSSMMSSLGHRVYLYAGPNNEAECYEHIPCIDEDMQDMWIGDGHYTQVTFDPNSELWIYFNNSVIKEISDRIEIGDIICLIGGYSQKVISDVFFLNKSVEFGIGYNGPFSKYRIYESYAWMHAHYGAENSSTDIDGISTYSVIPNYIELDSFTPSFTEGAYYLYMGRLIERKGIHLVSSACSEAGVELLWAGPGSPPDYGKYVGEVGDIERNKLLGGAIALICPTQYIEPFGTVAIESMACGTPVITSDWGAFTETVIDGVTGFRCRGKDEIIDALESVKKLDRKFISAYARDRYSTEIVKYQYDKYFDQIMNL